MMMCRFYERESNIGMKCKYYSGRKKKGPSVHDDRFIRCDTRKQYKRINVTYFGRIFSRLYMMMGDDDDDDDDGDYSVSDSWGKS